MTASARAFATFCLSVSLLLGVACIGATAAEPTGNSPAHKKSHTGKARQNANTPVGNPGVKQTGDDGQQYAKRGVCTGCVERIQKKTLQPPKPRNAKATPQAKHVTSRKSDKDPLPLQDRCKFADPDEAGSEALKIECNKAGYPTPRWPTRADSTSPQPTSPPTNAIDSAINSAIKSGLNSVEQSIDEDVSRAHGGRSTCPSDTSIEQDAISGCHE